MKPFLLLLCMGLVTTIQAQPVLLKLATPFKNQNTVASAKQYITGATCKGCSLVINDSTVYVWPTGAFAIALNLSPGDTSFTLKAKDPKGKLIQETVFYSYRLPEKPKTTTEPVVDYLRILPEGDLLLRPGDQLLITLKTLPNCEVKSGEDIVLTEVISADSTLPRGIYRTLYTVKQGDRWLANKQPLVFTIKSPNGTELQATTKSTYGLFSESPMILQTKGKLPFLLEGLGEDRLGGTKIGYLDSMVKLKAVAKIGGKYRVELAPGRTAYIEEPYVQPATNAIALAASLTGNMRVWGDTGFDYISLALSERLPYKTWYQIHPSRIVAEVYGATANTNWITQFQTAKEIRNVSYSQVADGVFRIEAELAHEQHWGHSIYYNGNTLVIRVKRQPAVLDLSALTIGIDAGHGGTNKGAAGALGIFEKEFTLLIAQELQQQLLALGTNVIMTRTKDTTYDNSDRILLYRNTNPDLVVSIHLNSSADPITTQGVSTYYKHIGFRPLSKMILTRMLELGLKDYGNVGNFNFMLNSPIEYPNVLVETLFISHPEDEMHICDSAFRKQMAEKITQGIKDWLKSCNR